MRYGIKKTLLVLLGCTSVCYAIPNNLHWKQLQLRQYVRSGVYNTDVQRVTDKAKQYLYHRILQWYEAYQNEQKFS